LLTVENITKRYPGVIALNNVCMELLPGKVNAILGENGAGKSTLMKILSGVVGDYEGRIMYNGQHVVFHSIKDAQACGIAIIHQELNLIPYLSVMENIFLGREIINSQGLLDKNRMQEITRKLLQRLKLEVDPDTKIAYLKVGQQQVIEIAKALLTDAAVIIMDEPTSAISENETAILFDIIASLKKENKTIVYISHKLDELFRIADRYIVLRDGCSIESGDMQGIEPDALIEKMVGRQITAMPERPAAPSLPVQLFRAENLALKHPEKKGGYLFSDVSFSLQKGEILGIFGLMGAGRTELMESIFGMRAPFFSGKIFLDEQQVICKSPADAIQAGLALVPEDRKKDGLITGLDVRTNISLTTLGNMETAGLLNAGAERALSKKYIGDLKIKTASDKQAVVHLSGGNQQKIVLAKWLAKNPKLLMLDEPTRGIDIHAKTEIYKLIHKLADQGLGIIVVSSELPELLTVADRILVMCEGKLTADIPVKQATENAILAAAIPKTNANMEITLQENAPSGFKKYTRHLAKFQSLIALFVLCLALSILSDKFLTADNAWNVLRQISVNICIATGMTLVVLTAGIDLSVGSVLALCGAIAAGLLKNGIAIPSVNLYIGFTVLGAIMAGLLTGCLAGLFNGWAITRFKVPPFVATLAMLTVARGLTMLWTKGFPISGLGPQFAHIGTGWFLGMPLPVWISGIIVLLAAVITQKTKLGRYIYAIGGNENAARLSGININKIKLKVYMIAGALAAAGGIVVTSRLDSAQPNAGITYELDAIAAVVIGGTSLSGGKGSIWGTVLGAVIIGVLNNGLVLLNVSPFFQQVVKGFVILLAVIIDKANSKEQ